MAGGGLVAVGATEFTPHMLYCFVVLYLLPEQQLMKTISEVKAEWRGGWGSPGMIVPPGLPLLLTRFPCIAHLSLSLSLSLSFSLTLSLSLSPLSLARLGDAAQGGMLGGAVLV